MRKLPIYFLIDVSESMAGDPIEQVQEGMRNIIQELRQDPYALETAYVSVIAFAGKAKLLSPLTEIYKFYPPVFPLGDGTSLGCALNFLMDDMDRSVKKTTMETKGDWKPIVFLFTDGTPTDSPTEAIYRWNKEYRHGANLVAISIGDNADTHLLGQMTENVLRLNSTDQSTFRSFFKWVSASISTSSQSVSESSSDELKLPRVDGINLEKVDIHKTVRVDENFAVLRAKCAGTKKTYLIKFAKRLKRVDGMESLGINQSRYYKLVNAYPIEEESYQEMSDNATEEKSINTTELLGCPVCPCCGNQIGFVTCGDCGKIFCAESLSGYVTCPWCGSGGEMGVNENGSNVGRTAG